MPTKRHISPSNSLNNKNTINLRTSEIPNYITYGGKHHENNCSGLTKNDIYKNYISCNTPQKLRVNNSLRTTVGQLNMNSTRNKFGSRL